MQHKDVIPNSDLDNAAEELYNTLDMGDSFSLIEANYLE